MNLRELFWCLYSAKKKVDDALGAMSGLTTHFSDVPSLVLRADEEHF